MTSNEKICQILKDIKEQSEINPNPKFVDFKFNFHIVGAGILVADEERRILLKLENEKVIKLIIPEEMDPSCTITASEYLMSGDVPNIGIGLDDDFEKKYCERCKKPKIKLHAINFIKSTYKFLAKHKKVISFLLIVMIAFILIYYFGFNIKGLDVGPVKLER